ncbi:MAG: pilus assembly protein [Chloroflexi bacterium]|nr:pilus assembly protein [Chloroflexota bacterium]
MTTVPTDRPDPTRRERSRRGQSLVEFALILPMLLVFLLGIADFGRVFAAGITMEALARNSAESAAQEYLQARRAAKPAQPPSTAYDAAFARAQEVACEEAETLSNRVQAGGVCSMPVLAVCIHDEWGNHCSSPSASADPSCARVASWPPTLASQSGGLPYVMVAGCYQFTTLINISDLRLPFGWSLTIGDIWLEKQRVFTVADY